MSQEKKIAIFVGQLALGGAELVALNQARGLKRLGFSVVLVVSRAGGDLYETAAREFEIVDLGTKRVFTSFLKLALFLKRQRPAVLISHYLNCNLASGLACLLTGRKTRLVIIEHGILWQSVQKYNPVVRAVVYFLIRSLYPVADQLVAVSGAIANETSLKSGLSRERIEIVPNPAIPADFEALYQEEPDHPWLLKKEKKVVIGVGRFIPAKKFEDLVHAFALVREKLDVRLVLLGEGPEKGRLAALIAELGLADHVAMPGFARNVFAWLKRSDLFVLPSAYEAFGNVVVEALACGAPVVATNVGGPVEILENGKYGALVPVGDHRAMADAILAKLVDEKTDREALRARGLFFSAARSAEAYKATIDRLLREAH